MKVRISTIVMTLAATLFGGAAMAQSGVTSLRQPASVQQTAYNDYVYADPQTPSPSPSDQPAAAPACECEDANKPWTLPQPCFLQRMGVTVGGWIDQGYSAAGRRATDGFNGVQTFNDRDREYQLNQLTLVTKRDVNTEGCGVDWGGRLDMVYGTDAFFLQAGGLERNWGQTGMYQMAVPQFYFDIGINDWTIRTGHFYTTLGYEVCTPPDNFFYSHSYSMQYGEPFTHTGMLFMRKVNDQLSFSAGFHRGIDQFDDSALGDDSLGFLGGVTWTSKSERLSLAFSLTASEEGPGNKVTIYSLVGKYKVSDKLTYVAQHDYGQASEPAKAEWYSLNQYLLYQLNDKWSLGGRYEIFRDNNGTRVIGVRPGNTHVGPYEGNFYETSVGLNWKPNPNIVVRPELRWDWFDGTNLGAGPAPFAGDRNDQFVFGMDMIITF
jgi:hypothetical protein